MMNTAFVSSFSSTPIAPSSFHGNAVRCANKNDSPANVVQAKYYLEKYNDMSSKQAGTNPSTPGYYLNKYDDMSGANSPAPVVTSPGPSAYWVAYQKLVKEKQYNYFARSVEQSEAQKMSATIAANMPYTRARITVNGLAFGKGGDPDAMLVSVPNRTGDRYMAECIRKQYKQTAAPLGTYTTQCTEGVISGQAEEARNMALSSSFRMIQRTAAQKFGDFCETRRKAVIAAHGCTYEENLLSRFPVAARAYVTSGSEARGNCVRYAEGTSVQETYMASCVDKQMKFRAVPYGVYDVLCSDGNTKGVAEFKRVQAMSAVFRSKQMSPNFMLQAKYNNAAYARDFFGHGCSYEEDLFNKYPAVSASMRPSNVRY